MKQETPGHDKEESESLLSKDSIVPVPLIAISHEYPENVVINEFKENVSHFSDQESELEKYVADTKIVSKNEVIESPHAPLFKIGVIAHCCFLGCLILQALSLYSIVYFYGHPETKGQSLLVPGLVIYFLSIWGILYAYLKFGPMLPQIKNVFLAELVSIIAFFVFLVCCLFYLRGDLRAVDLLYPCVVQLILGQLWISLAVSPSKRPFLGIAVVYELFMVQIIVVVWNIAFWHSNNWNEVLLLFYTGAIVMAAYSLVIMLITVCLFFMWLIRFRREYDDYIVSFYLLGVLVFYSGVGLFGLMIFVGFRNLLEQGSVFVENADSSHLDPFLLRVVNYELIFLGVIFVWLAIVGVFVFFKLKRKLFVRKTGRETKIYSSKLLMKMALVSGNYFKRLIDLKGDEKEGKLETCMVCESKKANCMLYPCGHTGFCMDCLREDQGVRDVCMVCKATVKKAKRIFYDEEDNCFFATMEEKFFQ